MSKSREEHYHNKGQEDAAEGKPYEPPHGIVEDLMTWDNKGMEKNAEDNEAYREGWRHAKDQE